MKKDKKIVRNFVVFESDMETLKEHAAKEDISVSKIVRTLIKEYLKKEGE
jgi:predicted DNA binding CopG/RHH family protein